MKKVQVIAGPCAVESEEQLYKIACEVKKAGAQYLRAGAFKMRTSPYDFQGLGEQGLSILTRVKKRVGIPVVSEITQIVHLPLYDEIDVIQVGARSMQNFSLLEQLGKLDKPVLLKRGFSNTIHELLCSAEYIAKGGNTNIWLCERGIRTFEPQTRNTLDLSAVPILKKLCPYPVLVDPSHASGAAWLVEPLSKAAVAVGADGIMVEVHNHPQEAMSDGVQSLDFQAFTHLMREINNMEG